MTTTNADFERTAARPITLLVCALGGEGGGVLAEWLVDTAAACGHSAQSNSIPGVAQRTGATTYYVEVFPRPDAELAGRRPVFGLSPVPGALDALVSSEPLETVRQIGQGMACADRTYVISSTRRTLTTAEKMQPGDGRASPDELLHVVRAHSREARLLDMAALAARAGTVTSAVLFGAIAGSGVLPFARTAFEQVIRSGGKGVDASLRGFALAFDALAGPQHGALPAAAHEPAAQREDAAPRLPAAAARSFPAATHAMLALGLARVHDYQGAAYAALYLERMVRTLQAEREADAEGVHDFAITRETARHLALWMAFDDIVRVADLKTRAGRMARVRGEAGAGEGELLRVYDHFKPGVPEFAALLPARWARGLARWDLARQRAGKAPLAWPLRIGTHTVTGFALLRALASLKGLRRRGQRYAAEQALIERWLAGVAQGTRAHWALGHEIAACGRLIKGYGSTNERGKENLLHALDHLALAGRFDTPQARAEAIRAARLAALADASGKAFDQALQRHGAPPREVPEQPIRWVRRPPGQGAAAAGERP
jgi:indolepyruvate ferredoxin oxidoreductase, beta subunit